MGCLINFFPLLRNRELLEAAPECYHLIAPYVRQELNPFVLGLSDRPDECLQDV